MGELEKHGLATRKEMDGRVVPDSESVNKGLIVRQSPINGRGLFANKPYKKGEVVFRWANNRLGMVLEQSANGITQTFHGEELINHSCDPNTKLEREHGINHEVAMRDIQTGEEITSDYRKSGNGKLSFVCNCGSSNCVSKSKNQT